MSRDHRNTIAELSPTAYALWRHNPVTAAFLQFLGDQAEEYERAAMDLWRAGKLTEANPQPHLHPEMLRGRHLALIEIRDLDLGTIKEFYGLGAADEETEEKGK